MLVIFFDANNYAVVAGGMTDRLACFNFMRSTF